MNAPIMRLFGVVVVLFALLVIWTSRWTVFDSKALQNNPLNRRTLIDEQRIDRGRIIADNGAVLAKSVKREGGTYTRTYPTGSLFAQAVGYSIVELGESAGLERSRGSELRGLQTGLSSIFGRLGGSAQVGDDVYTSLDPKAQAVARTGLGTHVGSVVALDPTTGAVKVMYSNPSYNDNNPEAASKCSNSCLLNLATQANYPPGSTFKVVTAAAGLDSGDYTPTSTINGKSPLTVSGVPLENDGNTSYPDVTLTDALTNSINTVFAQVGLRVGRPTMETYMKRFGFYSVPPLDYPPDEMVASGEKTAKGKLLLPTNDHVDLGRMSIGQDKLEVTPLQMAMVASAVANGGKLMVPHLTTKVLNQDGQTVETVNPSVYSQVMKPQIAAEETQMMTDVVEEGTGQAANLEGIKVAGKTGTAQVGGTGSDLDDAWFIGFAPVDHPKVAVAVALQDIPNGYGGVYAAPIAANVIKTLLGEGQ
jgi:peptidoglycan glycosyltransferase